MSNLKHAYENQNIKISRAIPKLCFISEDSYKTPQMSTAKETAGSPEITSPYTTVTSEIDSKCNTFQIVMDNLNINQKARHKTSENNNKVHNLTHSIAVQDRVASDGLDEVHPQADILSVPDEAFIPSVEDHHALYSDLKHLIQRTLVDFIPAFSEYKDVVQYHIDHEYSKESTKKSNVVRKHHFKLKIHVLS